MRIPSGTTDQYVYFVAVDATDFASRETGLASFTVYRSRNGGAAAAFTTPTINETDATNMPGVYELLLDEDTTIAAGNDSEEMVLHITHAGMAPVTRTIELYRPKITEGNTLDVTATGAAGIDWGNVENASTSVDLSATSINLCDTVTTNTDMRGTDNAFLAASAPTNFSDLAITVTTGLVSVGTNNDKTGYSISGTLTTLDALDTAQDTQHSTTQSAISGLNDPTAAAIADAVWDEAIAGHAGVGSTGEALSNATAPTAAAVADAVWDEALSGHLGAGSTGEALNAAGAAGDPWTTALPGAYGAGSAGYIIGNNIDAPLSTIDTVVDGIQTDLSNATDGLGAIKTAVDAIPTSNPTAAAIADAVLDEALAGHVTAGTLGKAVADIETDATAILADTADMQPKLGTPSTDLAADIAAVPTATENADALLNRDMSAVSDTTARSPLNALRFLRNKYSVSGTTLTVTKEDDTTSAWTSTLTTDAAADPVTGSDPA